MEDNGGSAPPRWTWKTSATSSPVTGPGALDSNSYKSLMQDWSDARGDRSTHSAQVKVEHGGGNISSPRRPYTTHQNRNALNHCPNNMPPPYYTSTIKHDPGYGYQSPSSPTFIPGYVYQSPSSPTSITGYGYQSPSSPTFIPGYGYQSPSSPTSITGYGYQSPSSPTSIPGYGYQSPFSPTSIPGYGPYGSQFPTGSFMGPDSQLARSDPQGVMHIYPAGPSYPWSPGVAQPPTPPMTLRESIVEQIEYYFSDENLNLISLMDNQGWVPISSIAGFNRIKQKNVDIPFIQDALQASKTIEVQGEKLRRRNEWFKWVPKSMISKSASSLGNSVNKDDQNEDKRDTLKAKSFGESSNDISSTFSLDEELELMQKTAGTHQSTAGRVDDDDEDEGIIDQAVVNLISQIRISSKRSSAINDGLYSNEQELNSKNIVQGSATLNSRTLHCSTGKSSSEGPGNPNSSRKKNKGNLKQEQRPKTFSPSQHPSHDGAVKPYNATVYNKYKKLCYSNRTNMRTGFREEMHTLYKFWFVFLRDTYDRIMYNDFCSMAKKDSNCGDDYGIDCLIKFYSYRLKKEFDDDLYYDFERLTYYCCKNGKVNCLEKFRAFHQFWRERRGIELPMKIPEVRAAMQ